MLMCLAGREAEYVVNGEYCSGSIDDMKKWNEMAFVYAMNQFDGLYFPEPENDTQLEYNLKKIEILRARQVLLLRGFFQENGEILLQMARELRESPGQKLERDRILAYLDLVKLDEAMFPVQEDFWNHPANQHHLTEAAKTV